MIKNIHTFNAFVHTAPFWEEGRLVWDGGEKRGETPVGQQEVKEGKVEDTEKGGGKPLGIQALEKRSKEIKDLIQPITDDKTNLTDEVNLGLKYVKDLITTIDKNIKQIETGAVKNMIETRDTLNKTLNSTLSRAKLRNTMYNYLKNSNYYGKQSQEEKAYAKYVNQLIQGADYSEAKQEQTVKDLRADIRNYATYLYAGTNELVVSDQVSIARNHADDGVEYTFGYVKKGELVFSIDSHANYGLVRVFDLKQPNMGWRFLDVGLNNEDHNLTKVTGNEASRYLQAFKQINNAQGNRAIMVARKLANGIRNTKITDAMRENYKQFVGDHPQNSNDRKVSFSSQNVSDYWGSEYNTYNTANLYEKCYSEMKQMKYGDSVLYQQMLCGNRLDDWMQPTNPEKQRTPPLFNVVKEGGPVTPTMGGMFYEIDSGKDPGDTFNLDFHEKNIESSKIPNDATWEVKFGKGGSWNNIEKSAQGSLPETHPLKIPDKISETPLLFVKVKYKENGKDVIRLNIVKVKVKGVEDPPPEGNDKKPPVDKNQTNEMNPVEKAKSYQENIKSKYPGVNPLYLAAIKEKDGKYVYKPPDAVKDSFVPQAGIEFEFDKNTGIIKLPEDANKKYPALTINPSAEENGNAYLNTLFKKGPEHLHKVMKAYALLTPTQRQSILVSGEALMPGEVGGSDNNAKIKTLTAMIQAQQKVEALAKPKRLEETVTKLTSIQAVFIKVLTTSINGTTLKDGITVKNNEPQRKQLFQAVQQVKMALEKLIKALPADDQQIQNIKITLTRVNEQIAQLDQAIKDGKNEFTWTKIDTLNTLDIPSIRNRYKLDQTKAEKTLKEVEEGTKKQEEANKKMGEQAGKVLETLGILVNIQKFTEKDGVSIIDGPFPKKGYKIKYEKGDISATIEPGEGDTFTIKGEIKLSGNRKTEIKLESADLQKVLKLDQLLNKFKEEAEKTTVVKQASLRNYINTASAIRIQLVNNKPILFADYDFTPPENPVKLASFEMKEPISMKLEPEQSVKSLLDGITKKAQSLFPEGKAREFFTTFKTFMLNPEKNIIEQIPIGDANLKIDASKGENGPFIVTGKVKQTNINLNLNKDQYTKFATLLTENAEDTNKLNQIITWFEVAKQLEGNNGAELLSKDNSSIKTLIEKGIVPSIIKPGEIKLQKSNKDIGVITVEENSVSLLLQHSEASPSTSKFKYENGKIAIQTLLKMVEKGTFTIPTKAKLPERQQSFDNQYVHKLLGQTDDYNSAEDKYEVKKVDGNKIDFSKPTGGASIEMKENKPVLTLGEMEIKGLSNDQVIAALKNGTSAEAIKAIIRSFAKIKAVLQTAHPITSGKLDIKSENEFTYVSKDEKYSVNLSNEMYTISNNDKSKTITGKIPTLIQSEITKLAQGQEVKDIMKSLLKQYNQLLAEGQLSVATITKIELSSTIKAIVSVTGHHLIKTATLQKGEEQINIKTIKGVNYVRCEIKGIDRGSDQVDNINRSNFEEYALKYLYKLFETSTNKENLKSLVNLQTITEITFNGTGYIESFKLKGLEGLVIKLNDENTICSLMIDGTLYKSYDKKNLFSILKLFDNKIFSSGDEIIKHLDQKSKPVDEQEKAEKVETQRKARIKEIFKETTPQIMGYAMKYFVKVNAPITRELPDGTEKVYYVEMKHPSGGPTQKYAIYKSERSERQYDTSGKNEKSVTRTILNITEVSDESCQRYTVKAAGPGMKELGNVIKYNNANSFFKSGRAIIYHKQASIQVDNNVDGKKDTFALRKAFENFSNNSNFLDNIRNFQKTSGINRDAINTMSNYASSKKGSTKVLSLLKSIMGVQSNNIGGVEYIKGGSGKWSSIDHHYWYDNAVRIQAKVNTVNSIFVYVNCNKDGTFNILFDGYDDNISATIWLPDGNRLDLSNERKEVRNVTWDQARYILSWVRSSKLENN